MASDSANKLTGIFKAIVTDVSCFPATGKIKTRISAFRGNSVPATLTSESYNSERFQASTYRDIYTAILVPFGGGSNVGAFKLPEVNSLGVVTFINNNPNMPLWIGGISAYYNDEGSLISVDYPSDNISENKGMLYKKSSSPLLEKNYEDENSFVLKTKTNVLTDFTKPETMDWTKNPVENTVILNSRKAHIHHRIADSSYSEFIMGTDNEEKPMMSLGFFNTEEDSSSSIKLDDMITISDKDGDKTSSIFISSDSEYGITLQTRDASGSRGSSTIAQINVTPTDIALSIGGNSSGNGSSSIIMSRMNNEVAISAKNIRLTADNISLGNTGYYVVVSPNHVAMTMEDGTMLTTTENIKV